MRSSSSFSVVSLALAWQWRGVSLTFVRVLLVRFGELAVILCSFVVAGVCVTVLGLLRGNLQCPLGQWFSIAVYASAFTSACSFTVCSVLGVLLSVT